MPKVKLSITPKTRIIRSWKLDTRVKIDAVIKELVDNSFDAFATTVTLHKSITGITIWDDGRGIKNIDEALSFGASDDESAHKRLGRHGIALKKGPARIARFLNIRTQSKSKLVNLELDWVALERSDEWSIEPNIDTRLKTDKSPTFTEIEMTGVYPFRINGWKDLPTKLSATFAPGLRDGKHIFFDGTLLEAPPKPVLENVIETAGEIPDGGGRGFFVQAGLHPENESGSLGIQIDYLHRVITEAWTPKFLLRCSLRRFAAYVTLIDGDTQKWELNNFKDDIDEEQQAELETALEPILKPLVEQLKDEAHNLKIKTLEKKFAQMIFGQGREPYLHEEKDGDRVIPPPPLNRKGRRQKRRRQQFSEKLGLRTDNGGTKATIRGERTFAFAFEELPQKRELIVISAYGHTGESLKLAINTAHKFGAELQTQFDRNEHGTIIATGLWALAGYITSKDDYQKTYRFMLNGQDSVFDATNLNVSRWLEYGAASV